MEFYIYIYIYITKINSIILNFFYVIHRVFNIRTFLSDGLERLWVTFSIVCLVICRLSTPKAICHAYTISALLCLVTLIRWLWHYNPAIENNCDFWYILFLIVSQIFIILFNTNFWDQSNIILTHLIITLAKLTFLYLKWRPF